MRKLVHQYAGNSTALPWLTFIVPTIIDEAICFSTKNPVSLLKEIRPLILAVNPDTTFILSHPGDSWRGLLKKFFLLRALGVNRNVFGWRMRSSIHYRRQAQHEAGMFEHKIFGPLRAIEECPLLPPVTEMEIGFPLAIPAGAGAWVENLWKEGGWEDSVVVAIAPGSIQPHKRWPLENFIELCRMLVQSYNVKLVVIGTASDNELGERIRGELPDSILNLAGEATIPRSAALLKRCALLVGNDGGAMHLGAAMGCRVVSIVPGIEYPGSIEPWGNADLAVRHEVPCAPCYSFTFCPEKHNRCIRDLPVEKVFANCAMVLDGRVRQRSGGEMVHRAESAS